MISRLFDFIDALDREFGATLNLLKSFARNRAHLRVDLAYGDLYVQPFLELRLLRPQRAHFGQCVTIDHWVSGNGFQVSSFRFQVPTLNL